MALNRLTKFCGGNTAYPSTWTRPADWLTLPTVNVGDQKIVGLIAVFPNQSNNIAITVAGAYTVDWGDGTAPANFATGVNASHNYDYTTLGSGTVTSEGFRQAIMVVTMQSGQTMTTANFTVTPTGTINGYVMQYREIVMAGASVSTIGVGGGGVTTLPAIRWFTYVGPSNCTIPKLTNLSQLRGITGTQWTSTMTDASNWLSGCSNLETVPLLDFSSVTNLSSAFQNCVRLRSVPLFNTASVINMTSTFSGCQSLTTVPLFDTSHVTNFTSTFSGCVSLATIPLLVTSAATTMQSMFSSCNSLASIPAFDVGNCTLFSSTFSSCSSLASVPASLNTVKGTDFSSMFINCSTLSAHPAMDVSLGINFTTMFQACISLAVINLPTSSKGTNFTSFCASCNSLRSLNINMTLATTVGQFQTSASSLASVILTGLRFTTSMASLQLDATALDAMYTSLGTASGAQTITVTSNPGIATDTPSIATGKGWTVTGS